MDSPSFSNFQIALGTAQGLLNGMDGGLSSDYLWFLSEKSAQDRDGKIIGNTIFYNHDPTKPSRKGSDYLGKCQ